MKRYGKSLGCLVILTLLLGGCGKDIVSNEKENLSENELVQEQQFSANEELAEEEKPGPDMIPEKQDSHLDEVWLSRVLFDEYPIFCPETEREITIGQLSTMVSGDPDMIAEVRKYTLVDLDGDGLWEAVLWLEVNGNEAGGFVVLKRYGDTLHGYYLWHRAFSDLKDDGTFRTSGSAGDSRIARLSFSETGGYAVQPLAERETAYDEKGQASVSFFLGGESVSEAEYLEYLDEFEGQQEAFWRDHSRLAGTSCTVSRADGREEMYRYILDSDGSAAVIGYSGPGGDVVIPAVLDGRPVSAIGHMGLSTGAFQGREGVTSVAIPDGVKVIYDNAFYDCIDLADVTIPASVTLIWHCAFAGCYDLKAVYFEGDAPSIAHYVFSSSPTLYHREGAEGWTDPFYGCKTVVWPESFEDLSFTLQDTLIDGVSLWSLTYARLIETFGEPLSAKRYEVGSPIYGETPLMVIEYPDLAVEFLLPASEGDLDAARATRFDITGPAYSLKGIAVGMTEARLRALYGEPVFYNLADIAGEIETRDDWTERQKYHLISGKKLLTDYKPESCYDGYDRFLYLSGWVSEEENSLYPEGMTTALGAVILMDGDRVGRIVLGHPTAG